MTLSFSPTRRQFLYGAAALAATPLFAAKSKLKIGVTDWNLGLSGKTEAVALAASLGFEGVQISLGWVSSGDKLPLADEGIQQKYLEELKKHKIAAAGTCLDVLHKNWLKSDKLGQKWVADSLPITRKLNAKVVLLPFFGRGELKTHEEMDYVGDFLREIGPEAAKNQVTIGLENTISAEDNVRILERAKSDHVKVYYDVGNSTGGGFDVVKEIAWLGANRICQFHLKDNPHYLGEGKIDFPAVMNAIGSLGFTGFANLETDSPSHSVPADMKRNLAFIRGLMNKS
ncbi:MAG: sugar phosphate isomerase/epimerase [Bryobacteraceae bacterium]|nr:sugar phosphate isomerase/epimerase [Bryobacteraceae bacterium]